MRVRLNVPPNERKNPDLHGLWRKYHGCCGVVLCGAGDGGVWVRFDGMDGYEGVPLQYLEHE